MSDFKVGDEVTIRKDLSVGINYGSNKQTFNLEITDGMIPFLGHTREIMKTSAQDNYWLKGCTGWWSDAMVNLAKKSKPEPKSVESVTITTLKDGATTEYHKYNDLEHGEKFFWDKTMEFGHTHSDCQIEITYFIDSRVVNSIVMRSTNVKIVI